MFSHVMLGCSDRERSKKFYDATMAALGHKPGQDFGKSDWWMTKQGALGSGQPIDGHPCSVGNGSTIGLVAPSPEAVISHTTLYWKWQSAPGRRGGTVDTAEVSFAAAEES